MLHFGDVVQEEEQLAVARTREHLEIRVSCELRHETGVLNLLLAAQLVLVHLP